MSMNTLSYGKELLKKGLMSPFGIKMYKEGLLKKPHDFGIPKNPKLPTEMKELLLENRKLDDFMKLSRSIKRSYYRRFLRIRRAETKDSFIKSPTCSSKGLPGKHSFQEGIENSLLAKTCACSAILSSLILT